MKVTKKAGKWRVFCQGCGRDHTNHIQKIFKYGYETAENDTKKTLRKLQTTNNALYEELCRLDKIRPLPDSPDTIWLHIHFVNMLIKNLSGQTKAKNRSRLVRQLKEIIALQQTSIPDFTEDLEDLITS